MLLQILAIYQYFNIILCFFLIIIFSLGVFYIKFVGFATSLYYKLYYVLGFFILILGLFYNYLEILILYLFKDITDEIYIRDSYDIINIELVFVIFYMIIFVFFYFIYVSCIFLLNILSKNIYAIFIFIIFIMYIYLIFCLWVVENDLFLSNWFTITTQLQFSYKVQLDLKMLAWVFFEEFWTIINFLIYFWLAFFLECFIYLTCFFQIERLYIWNWVRFSVLGFSSVSFYQFFGGESLIRDFLLLGINFFICELLFFCFIFFYKVKLKNMN